MSDPFGKIRSVDTRSGEPRWLSDEEQDAWRAYLWAGRELDVALNRDLIPHDVSLAEYELLSMLSEAPEGRLRMSALADLIVQSRSRVTHTASRLESRGWVRRTPSPTDGRGVILTLTPVGRGVVERVARVHVESVRQHFIDVLTPEQLSSLGGAMRALREAYAVSPAPGRRDAAGAS